jgi:hypothetical protein
MADMLDAFLAQNTKTARHVTEEQKVELREWEHAEHHSGGLIVLGRPFDEGLYVKMHDGWGNNDDPVLHIYSLDDGSLDIVMFPPPELAIAYYLNYDFRDNVGGVDELTPLPNGWQIASWASRQDFLADKADQNAYAEGDSTEWNDRATSSEVFDTLEDAHKAFYPPLPQPDPANTNCLAGFRCPKCGQTEEFEVVATVSIKLIDSGTLDADGDTEWDDESRGTCNECGHVAPAKMFFDHTKEG